MTQNPIILIATLAFATLLPFVLAVGSCFIKFSIVFSLLRNAIGLQQVPSNLTLNGLALIMTAFVMMPIFNQVQQYYSEHNVDLSNQASMHAFLDDGLGAYRQYLAKYAEPELVEFFGELQDAQLREHPPGVESPRPHRDVESDYVEQAPLLVLLPAYALSELKSAFKIGFYIYLPFLVVDMLISNILLALGMMMMSPVTIALPIKLILFVLLDGWEKLVKGLVLQYIDLAK
ncbi:EscR/YscR/HrcR family type III secretion system export apparatus protein [Pandoraea pulmonicola]|uniref:EscR/YscR/HrcR family type III secretion system export apparatus protein n=2 Tax=Pandoraea pulmonicola TaxID=93221 RepID=A0ABN4EP23_PANPU|nr:EscR/YscR/HrcR family type III secretion system export apparatus protein [Pandoraea pulmonicola]AJC21242.1 EscR/YscR/HrcR family type III secretion system export apparatus protein [Pandoraea pulmonicola]